MRKSDFWSGLRLRTWRRLRPSSNPGLVWGWYEWRRTLVAQVKPNAGHLAIAQGERSRDLTIVTQNVDDLHERAHRSPAPAIAADIMDQRRKTANVVNVAIAREMVGFIWSIACAVQSAPGTP
jgi:hypothetical protein